MADGHARCHADLCLATFTYSSMAEMDKVFSGEEAGYVYSRYGNPTVAALQDALQMLEGGAGACAYASGMAALHAALWPARFRRKPRCWRRRISTAILDLLVKVFRLFGVTTVTCDFSDLHLLGQGARSSPTGARDRDDFQPIAEGLRPTSVRRHCPRRWRPADCG